jgi:hypothetical protein
LYFGANQKTVSSRIGGKLSQSPGRLPDAVVSRSFLWRNFVLQELFFPLWE